MSNSFRILLVEDDESMGFLIKDSLEMTDYEVVLATDGKKGAGIFFNEPFHLCLIDVMLPEKDGFALAREIRKINQEVPIVFLTARNAKVDRIKGFQLGGDDYITKPFSIEELKLRIQALLRRTYREIANSNSYSEIYFGKCSLDVPNQILLIGEQQKELTYREVKLLKLLGTHPNQLLEREMILQAVWEDEGILVGRSLDVFISRLRKILKVDPSLTIQNVHGVGYRLKVEEYQ